MPQSNVRRRPLNVLNAYYANEFKRHVLETRDGLPTLAQQQQQQKDVESNSKSKGKGKQKEEVFEGSAPADDEGEFVESFVRPASVWTTDEKERFFKALRSYSRLRPDMIAECVGSKSVFEVCAYLDYLENEKDRSIKTNGLKRRREEEAATDKRRKLAAEEEEENQPVSLSDLDPYDLEGAMEMSDEWVEFEEHQARFLILEELQAANTLQEVNTNEDPQPSGPGRLLTGGQYLSFADLEAMETLLRQEEDAELGVVPTETKARYAGQDGYEEQQSPRRRRRSVSTSRDLIMSSHRPWTDQTRGEREDLGEDEGDDDDELMDLDDQELDIELDGNHDEQQEVENEEEESLNDPYLSRAARRRLQKRLYMRRQRALKKGMGIASVDMTSVKLQPGRKKKVRLGKGKARARQGATKSASTSVASHSDSDPRSDSDSSTSDSDGEGYYAYGNKGGKTAYTRAKQNLEEQGINANVLHKEGIGLFHLSDLARLTSIYASVYRTPDASIQEYPTLIPDKQPLLSADLIRLVTASTIEFVASIIQRALVISEQQNTSKKETKVWRVKGSERGDVVSAEAARVAVAMSGANSKKQLLEGILEDNEQEEEDEEPEETDVELYQDLYPCHIYLPLPYRTPQTDEDVVIDDEYDYQKELQADDSIDKKDMAKAMDYEENLWLSI